jgi:hypothetical protein
MAKFRKKPVVIEAEQFDGTAECADRLLRMYASNVSPECEPDGTFLGRMLIDTLEGQMIASPGDWIITGVKGERYPCKDEIFRITYEPAEQGP